MVSESYDWWTQMIAVPRTPELEKMLRPFRDAQGVDDLGVSIEDYGRRLVATVYCSFEYEGPVFDYHEEDHFESLAERLTVIRRDIMNGNVSFLREVASFYEAETDEEGDEADDTAGPPPLADLEHQTKAGLQELCTARGIDFRTSWTKQQLLDALAASTGPERRAVRGSRASRNRSKGRAGPPGKAARLSKPAREIINSLSRP